MSFHYFAEIRRLLDFVEQTGEGSIERAADTIVVSALNGGRLHVYDTGHMLAHELVHRAGGLMMMTPFRFNLQVEDPIAPRESGRERPAVGPLAVELSRIEAGDCLIIGSVSGKADVTVDIALKARELGATVIAITSLPYSGYVESVHPSGKRLFEVADIVLDHHAAIGDAALEVEGMERKICPTSGVMAACILWAVTERVVDKLAAEGTPACVYRSLNLPDGATSNKEEEATFFRRGW